MARYYDKELHYGASGQKGVERSWWSGHWAPGHLAPYGATGHRPLSSQQQRSPAGSDAGGILWWGQGKGGGSLGAGLAQQGLELERQALLLPPALE